MKTQNSFQILSVVIVAFVLMNLAFASALIEVTKSNDFSGDTNQSYFTIRATSNSTITLNYPELRVNDGNNHYMTVSLNPSAMSNYELAAGQQIRVNASVVYDSTFDFELRDYVFPNINVVATDPNNSSITQTAVVEYSFTKGFCEVGEKGDLEITRLVDERLDNEDSWEWKPLDNIEVTVRISNDMGEDEDFVVEYGLFDPDTEEFLDFDEDSVEVSIDDGDNEEVTLNFQVPASGLDFDSSSKNFRFYVKAYVDGDEESFCTDTFDNEAYQTVEIKKERMDVILTDIKVPSDAVCGEEIQLTAKVVNIGRQDERRVKVRLVNTELGLNLESEPIRNLDMGDEAKVTFSFKIPEDSIEGKNYVLNLETAFDYDTGDESYDEVSSRDFSATVQASGSCVSPNPINAVSISPTIDTPANQINAGNTVEITARITNVGEATSTYVISVTGVDDFATVESINPTSVTLLPGKSADVSLKLKLNEDATAEEQLFNIRASFDGKNQDFAVRGLVVSQSSSGGITGFGIFDSISANPVIAGIVILNILLIVVIIVVAIRVARK